MKIISVSFCGISEPPKLEVFVDNNGVEEYYVISKHEFDNDLRVPDVISAIKDFKKINFSPDPRY